MKTTIDTKHQTGSSPLLSALRVQMGSKLRGGIYHRTEIDLTYHSSRIEGSRLTKDQTRYIYETNTIGVTDEAIRVDDIIETTNHFRCVDYIIAHAAEPISKVMIKEIHGILKAGISDADREWFAMGDYKKLPSEVGGQETTPPERVASAMQELLQDYSSIRGEATLEELIHPFQDGNGCVGRLILFKECLRYGIVPFIITEEVKMYYYRGLSEWPERPGYLMDTCLTAQDQYKALLDYFRIPY